MTFNLEHSQLIAITLINRISVIARGLHSLGPNLPDKIHMKQLNIKTLKI